MRTERKKSLTLSIFPIAKINVSILLLDILVTNSFPVNVFTPKKKDP